MEVAALAVGAGSMSNSKTRCLEALEISSDAYGVGTDLDALQAAGNWQPDAVAMLAEVVAALLVEVKPKASTMPVVRNLRPPNGLVTTGSKKRRAR